ncbi:hypothetical protein [Litorimonas sp.]|uniref:hypothetical protein n=1 Tax=Litorimonas sp. TaxID=1892381 RepID=UPI003A8B44BB
MPPSFFHTLKIYSSILIGIVGLTACSSIKAPKIDLMGGSAFDEDIQNIDSSIPSVNEAPDVPTDVRSDADWDMSATSLMEVRDGFSVPEKVYEQPSEEELKENFQELKNQAQAYKADDPQ